MPAKQFRKGDRVRFQWGVRFVEGDVKADRGPIGIKGRHLYLVVFPFDSVLSEIELPAVDMELVPDAASAKR